MNVKNTTNKKSGGSCESRVSFHYLRRLLLDDEGSRDKVGDQDCYLFQDIRQLLRELIVVRQLLPVIDELFRLGSHIPQDQNEPFALFLNCLQAQGWGLVIARQLLLSLPGKQLFVQDMVLNLFGPLVIGLQEVHQVTSALAQGGVLL